MSDPAWPPPKHHRDGQALPGDLQETPRGREATHTSAKLRAAGTDHPRHNGRDCRGKGVSGLIGPGVSGPERSHDD
ncbi:hypothetical protein OSI36_23155, partial [Mycobacterium ulcerans]